MLRASTDVNASASDFLILNQGPATADYTYYSTTSSATVEIARDAWNGHSRSLKVIRCCANRRGIYDFLSALI